MRLAGLTIVLGLPLAAAGLAVSAGAAWERVQVVAAAGERWVEARVVVEALDGGVLLEHPDQRLEVVPAAEIRGRHALAAPPGLPSARELGDDVLRTLPAGFDQLAQRRYQNTLIPGHFEAIAAMGLRNPANARSSGSTDPYPSTLTTVTTPVMLIAGTQDALLDADWGQKLSSHLPAAPVTIKMLPTGHSPNLDQAELTASVLLSFLRTH